MTLNPAFEPILAMMEPLAAVDWSTVPAAEMRAMLDNPMTLGEPIAMARVEDHRIVLAGRTLNARLYVPEGVERPPLTVYFHGGGWVIGTLDTHDGSCRALAEDSGAAVLSVAYRLAPEHRYPAAVEDCYDATRWAAAHAEMLGVDGTGLAVAGDSAGGNLAAAVAIKARDSGPALRHQLLIYPVTDARFDRASYAANGGGGYFLSTVAMRRFWADYLGDRAADDAPLAAILRRSDLAGLPPATVITAEYDPLKDEGEAYAARLAEAGVPVEAIHAPGMIHGCFGMFEMVPDVRPLIARAGASLARSFAA